MSADKTALYYINKRIDTLEESLQEQMNRRFDLVERLLKDHLEHCNVDMEVHSVRIGRLESFKNKAVGAVALFMALVALWKARGGSP